MDEREAIRALLQMGQLPTADKIQQVISASTVSIEEPVHIEPSRTHLEGEDYAVEIINHFEYIIFSGFYIK